MLELRTLKEILAEHPIFRDLEPAYLELIAGCAWNVRFAAGESILREGEEASRFYLIRHGRVALETHTPGRGLITIETLEEGEVLGWSWLIPPYRNHFDARAVTLTRATAFDGTCIRRKSEEDPRLGYALLKQFAQILVQRLQSTRLQLLDVYGYGPRQ
jgi:CRP-like cAMP-binding protein